ncbi:MAG: hypothetical protein KJO89_12825, partial [Deltaproteobacteria bacterium]|nr:hypothetical protein [Deltaproteobacteria bacterium]
MNSVPGAAVASLRLAGASRRASPCGLALPPAVGKPGSPCHRMEGRGKNASWGGVNRAIEERLATGVLAIGRPVAMAPQVDLRLGAGP